MVQINSTGGCRVKLSEVLAIAISVKIYFVTERIRAIINNLLRLIVRMTVAIDLVMFFDSSALLTGVTTTKWK